MSQDLPVIYRAADVAEADIVVSWLAQRGIAADVKDRFAAATLQVPMIVAPQGIEVFVLNAEEADQARGELRDHFDEAVSKDAAQMAGPVETQCEECGQTSSFPGSARGKVETCPHCGEYVDVLE